MEKNKKVEGRKGQKGMKSPYDISFRRRVAQDYKEGNRTMQEVGQAYGVPKYSVKKWIDKFNSELSAEPLGVAAMTQEEQKVLEALKKQNEALRKKLEHEQMRNFALETMIDLAKEELGVDIRKNSGAKQPEE